MSEKIEFLDRIIALVKDDKDLHDATVRLIDSMANVQEEKALKMKAKREEENAKKG